MDKKYEKSCGVVVFHQKEEQVKVLLVHHNQGHWGIPKGHMEQNEKEEETAIREVLEETGITVALLEGFREVIHYCPYQKVEKDVVFFIGKATKEEIKVQEEELIEALWVDMEKSLDRITYQEEKEVMKKAIEVYSFLC